MLFPAVRSPRSVASGPNPRLVSGEKRIPGALLPFAKEFDPALLETLRNEGPPVPYFLTKQKLGPNDPNPLAPKNPVRGDEYIIY